ncbi:hypothetical protein M427DRAFT_57978 [Gonapodya prolifera JEL478]|uniref:DUF410-domain-containing protein n=1 Tax=Gonapodya prolifera (strain JEL478) TaxID=1344416 RepID=A0A139AAW4_GONPJ|nr:hypothetical protein M427DRAFT_57978 [Gonapodya prolifera JEL478]|eukprot:KXS13971.1 hypothetical protein M427DRAFT_57978 [Gonapodya prolifera JEL478]
MSGGTDKFIQKLQKSVEDKNYYEAHQMYLSVAQRYIKAKKYTDAQSLLHSGITNFTRYAEHGSAQSLLSSLLDVWDHAGGGATETRVATLTELAEGFPLGTKQAWGEQVVKDVVRWTAKNGKDKNGDAEFHHAAGMRFYKAKLYYLAEHHLVLGTPDSAKIAALMAWTWSQEVAAAGGPAVEVGYFEARNVLQYILLHRLNHASLSLSTFLSNLSTNSPSSIITPPSSLTFPTLPGTEFTLTSLPMLNLVQLIYATVQRRAGDLYADVRKIYGGGRGGDPWIEKLLDKIGESYFQIGVSRQPNVLNMLFGNRGSAGGAGGGGPARGALGAGAKRSVQTAELD